MKSEKPSSVSLMKTEKIIMTNFIENFIQLNFGLQLVIIYLFIINIVTFFYFGLDKIKARLSHRRISEKILWFFPAIGGSIGALAGMYFFRHKTKKASFQTGIAIILAIQILLLYFLFG